MTKRLYVGGLPDHVTDEILENLFSAYGTVESVTVMINKITDLPNGFGFVEMSCESEAEEAIQNLNGTQFEGGPLRCMRHDQGRFHLAERALGDIVSSLLACGGLRMIWTGLALSLLGVILLTIVGLIWTNLANWMFTIGAVLMLVGLAILVLST